MFARLALSLLLMRMQRWDERTRQWITTKEAREERLKKERQAERQLHKKSAAQVAPEEELAAMEASLKEIHEEEMNDIDDGLGLPMFMTDSDRAVTYWYNTHALGHARI